MRDDRPGPDSSGPDSSGPDSSDWVEIRREQSGVVSSAQAVRMLGRGIVRSRLAQGRWRRICRTVLLTENGRLHHEQQLWAAVLAAGPGAHIAGATALAAYGLRAAWPEPLHVLVPAERSASPLLARLPADMPAVRVHRTSVLPPGHRRAGRPPRTSVARSVVDAAAWATTDDQARTVLAAACQQRLVRPGDVREVLHTLARVRRRRLIGVTLADVEGGAHALSEIDFLALCRRYRLPLPDLQAKRRDAYGRQRYLDAYWRAFRLHAEVDGAHHMDTRHWAADMLRQNALWISGDRVLRFPAWLIRAHPDRVAAQLRAALTAPR
jgi:very-short-patch-repair endonuclease